MHADFLNVWPCAQQSPRAQRAGRYVTGHTVREHRHKMAPEVARRILAAFSEPGDLVVDPMCGTGTSLVEGARAGRRCFGYDCETTSVRLTGANLEAALSGQCRELAEVGCLDARVLHAALGSLHGRVDLVILHPPAGRGVGSVNLSRWRPQPWWRRISLTHGSPAQDLGRMWGRRYLQALTDVIGEAADALGPGGHLALVSRPGHTAGRLDDLASASVQLAASADTGLVYLQHIIAPRAVIRDGRILPQPTPWQARAARAGNPARARHLVVHDNITVFVKPNPAEPTHRAGH
jgi:modification methylase